jgi:hypothetical protein
MTFIMMLIACNETRATSSIKQQYKPYSTIKAVSNVPVKYRRTRR